MPIIPFKDFKRALSRLDSPAVRAALDRASGFSQAVQFACELPASRMLLSLLRGHLELRALLFESVQNLVSTVPDPRYESPNDATLFCILVVAEVVDHAVATQCADLVRSGDNLWWARHGAIAILENKFAVGEHRREAPQEFLWPSEGGAAISSTSVKDTPNVEYRLPLSATVIAAGMLVGVRILRPAVKNTEERNGIWRSRQPNLNRYWSLSHKTNSHAQTKLGALAA
jgi:hypothetical protein